MLVTEPFKSLFQSTLVVIGSILSNSPLRNRGLIRVFHAAVNFASYEFPWDILVLFSAMGVLSRFVSLRALAPGCVHWVYAAKTGR